MEKSVAFLWCATSGVAPLLIRSFRSARAAGIDSGSMHLLLLDGDVHAAVRREGIEANFLVLPQEVYSELGIEQVLPYNEYGTDRFNRLSFLRYAAIHHLLDAGFEYVIYADADILFLANPMDDLIFDSPYASDAVLAQNDRGDWDKAEARIWLAKGENIADENICTGFMLWRNLPKHRQIIRRLLALAAAVKWRRNDQELFNTMQVKIEHADAIQVLPACKYPNGAYFSTFRESIFESAPYIFHANWVVGVEAKQDLMADFMRARSGVG